MTKLLTVQIDKCEMCPHCDAAGDHILDMWCCLVEDTIYPDERIPDWCPLPDISEQPKARG